MLHHGGLFTWDLGTVAIGLVIAPTHQNASQNPSVGTGLLEKKTSGEASKWPALMIGLSQPCNFTYYGWVIL